LKDNLDAFDGSEPKACGDRESQDNLKRQGDWSIFVDIVVNEVRLMHLNEECEEDERDGCNGEDLIDVHLLIWLDVYL
jgi:hypothetical protein